MFIGITLLICMPNINVVLWHTHRMTEKIKVYDQFYRLIPLIVSIHIQIYMIAGKKFFFTLDKTKPCNIYTILTLLLSLDTNYQKHYHSFPTIHLRSTCIQEEKLLLSSIYINVIRKKMKSMSTPFLYNKRGTNTSETQ